MCGRVTLTKPDLRTVADVLEAEVDDDSAQRYRPRYNIAPTDLHWVLIDDAGKRRIVPAVWGLPGGKRPVINVRAEVVQRGAFRSRKHGLVITDGYFEWLRQERVRRPFWYHRPDELLLLAALDTPLTSSTKAATAFCVITVGANREAAAVHDRMPAIIAREHIDEWLRAPAGQLLAPAPDGSLMATEVTTRVNRVANDDAACLVPIATTVATPLETDDGERRLNSDGD
jgi:putative SOS response-associated peptidase YedK